MLFVGEYNNMTINPADILPMSTYGINNRFCQIYGWVWVDKLNCNDLKFMYSEFSHVGKPR